MEQDNALRDPVVSLDADAAAFCYDFVLHLIASA